MTPEQIRADAIRRRALAQKAKTTPISPEEQAERDRMIAIANDRMVNGAGVVSAKPQEGLTFDPRDGTYKNRRALSEGYEPSRANAVVGGAMQGLGLNFGDEVIGLMGRAFEGPGMGDLRREQARAQLEKQQAGFPVSYGVSEVAGNVGTAAAALPAAVGGSMLGTMAKGAALGAGEGFAYGLGDGEGVEDRLNKGAQYGVVGGVVGGAAPVVVGAAAKAGRGILDSVSGGIDSALNRGSKSRASRALAETLKKSGKTADDVTQEVATASLEGQPEFRIMDALGLAGQRRASGVVRAGGDGAEELARFLQQRQIDQGNRVGAFVEDAFGFTKPAGTANVPATPGATGKVSDVLKRPVSTADKLREALKGARKATADDAYDAARGSAKAVDVREALSVIDDRIGGMQGSGVAGDSIDGRLNTFRSRLASQPGGDAFKGADSVEMSDFDRVLGVKQDVQDAIGAAVRAGRNNEARELGRLQTALDEALEAASDGYRAANDGFRADSRVISALDDGAQMARPSRRADDTVSLFNSMTPDEKAAARIGYGDKALAKIEGNASPTANVAKPFNSTKAQTEAAAMATDPRLFSDRIARENAMWETQNRALGGSRTADNMQDISSVGPMSNLVRAAKSAMSLQMGDAAASVGAAVGPALSGNNEATRKIIADMLMSKDAGKTLAPVLKQQKNSEAVRAVLEALLRNAGREPAHSAMIPR